MSRAIVLKTLRDTTPLLVLLTVGILLFEVGVARMLIEAAHDLEHLQYWLERPLIKSLMRLALGADLAGDFTPTTMAILGLVHPVTYALAWTLLLTLGSGVVAGEIGRGTADLLLTLPISRACIYISTSLAALLAVVVVSIAPVIGLLIGEMVFPQDEPLDFSRLWLITVNFLALNLALTGLTLCVSSMVSRRGKAVGVVLAVVLVSDVVNLLALFWDLIAKISFLGFLHYYRPLPIVRSGQLPIGDMAVLLGFALVAWLIGLRYFSRRDIPGA